MRSLAKLRHWGVAALAIAAGCKSQPLSESSSEPECPQERRTDRGECLPSNQPNDRRVTLDADGCPYGDYSDAAGTICDIEGMNCLRADTCISKDQMYSEEGLDCVDGHFQYFYGDDYTCDTCYWWLPDHPPTWCDDFEEGSLCSPDLGECSWGALICRDHAWQPTDSPAEGCGGAGGASSG
jgi:hypothetical protein